MFAARDFRAGYVRRVVDDEIDELIDDLPALLLDGPKGVGKTETALQRATTVRRLDRARDRQVIESEPGRIRLAKKPLLLDEWQRLPQVWDTVRHQVDTNPAGGQFLLTGSDPSLVADATHTGAGRIATVRLRPLTLPERLDLTPAVSLAGLIAGHTTAVDGHSEFTLTDYLDEIAGGGLPGLRHLTGRPLRNQLDSYVELIVTRELPEAGYSPRQADTLLGWLRAYAAATATTTSLEKLRRAVSPETNPPAATTVRPYAEFLTALRILDPLPGWHPTLNHLRSLTTSPKHHLADPALALRLLNLDPDSLLDGTGPELPIVRDGTYLGALFESLVALTLRVFAQSSETRVAHLRTKGGRHEIDFIIDTGQHILAIETKLAATVTDTDLQHLHWLRQTLTTPTTLAVITTGTDAYTRKDGIHIIPLALLGP